MNQSLNVTVSTPKRSGVLDLLRFFAVTIVFLTHYLDTYNYIYNIVPSNLKYTPVFHYGSISLFLFFMISGYVVTMTSIKKGIREFLVTRLSRIYPLFWVSCAVAFILPRLMHEHTYVLHANLRTFAANLTMMPEQIGYAWINPVFHTLLLELVFYAFIAIIIVFKLWKNFALIIFLVMLLFFGISLDTTVVNHIFIPPFTAGMLFFLIKTKSAKGWKLYALLFMNYASALLAGHIMLSSLNSYYKDPGALNFWIVSAIFTLIYVLFYLIVADKMTIRASWISTKLGELAYPVYLFHIYFLFIYWYFRDTINGELLVVGIFTLILIASFFINLYIEKPSTKFTASLVNRLLNIFSRPKSTDNVSETLVKR
jgi:peptidoglycan/LPS O-acetylase OafA/YrhL